MDILFGFGVSNVGLPGMNPFSIARIAFSSPEMPAAGSECPMLLLIYNKHAILAHIHNQTNSSQKCERVTDMLLINLT